jgi:hypothetical protein
MEREGRRYAQEDDGRDGVTCYKSGLSKDKSQAAGRGLGSPCAALRRSLALTHRTNSCCWGHGLGYGKRRNQGNRTPIRTQNLVLLTRPHPRGPVSQLDAVQQEPVLTPLCRGSHPQVGSRGPEGVGARCRSYGDTAHKPAAAPPSSGTPPSSTGTRTPRTAKSLSERHASRNVHHTEGALGALGTGKLSL